MKLNESSLRDASDATATRGATHSGLFLAVRTSAKASKATGGTPNQEVLSLSGVTGGATRNPLSFALCTHLKNAIVQRRAAVLQQKSEVMSVFAEDFEHANVVSYPHSSLFLLSFVAPDALSPLNFDFPSDSSLHFTITNRQCTCSASFFLRFSLYAPPFSAIYAASNLFLFRKHSLRALGCPPPPPPDPPCLAHAFDSLGAPRSCPHEPHPRSSKPSGTSGVLGAIGFFLTPRYSTLRHSSVLDP